MYKTFNDLSKHVHIIGIGGKGLNGIASILHKQGIKVTGSDLNKNDVTNDLELLGIKIQYHHNPEFIKTADEVVFSSVIRGDNLEIIYAKEKSIPIYKRSEYLGKILEKYTNYSVAGSHGKSTTTALLGLSLSYGGYDPTIFGGAFIKEFHSYERLGRSKISVTEACEYDRSFLSLPGKVSIITSIEKSHLEYYLDEEEMQKAFLDFMDLHQEGFLVLCGDDPVIMKMSSKTKSRCIFYGIKDHNHYKTFIHDKSTDGTIFSIFYQNQRIFGPAKIHIPGEYNVQNITGVVALMHQENYSLDGVYIALKNFRGVGRRFEMFIGSRGTILIDDFAHHPTQVKNLIEGVKQFFPEKHIWAVFEPRQYHLIKSFIKEYGMAFQKVDEVILTDIVPALGDTEEDKSNLKIEDIINSIKKWAGKIPYHFCSYQEIASFLKDKLSKNEVVTTIGAGKIYQVRDILKSYV
jgi:UDP-N-acetylmuramate--alanine ligase